MTTELGDAVGRVMLDASGVKSAMQQAQTDAKRGFSAIGDHVKNLGTTLSNTGKQISLLTAPITLLQAKGVRAFMDLDDALIEVQARTGATADEMARVREKAMALGGAYGGPARVTEAMLQLLSSGYDINETFDALTPILDAAAASGMDLGMAADAVTDILAMFNLEAAQAGYVSDILAKAAGASSAEIGDLMEGFGNVGPIAAQFGLDVEQTAAVLAIFAENGVKGAEAGTQLKSMLTHLSSPTKEVQEAWDKLGLSMFEANGDIKPIPLLLEQLSGKLKTLTPQERIQAVQALAGSFGQIGATILTSNMSIDEMIALMDKQADAATVAKAKLASLRGVLTRVKTTLDILLINALTPSIEDGLKPFAENIIVILEKVNEWILANPELTTQMVQILTILTATGPALYIVGRGISAIGVAISGVGSIISLVGSLISFALTPVGLIILGLVAIAGAFYLAYKNNFLGIADIINNFITLVGPWISWFGSLIGGLIDYIKIGDWDGAFNQLGIIFDEFRRFLDEVVLPQIKTVIGKMAASFSAWVTEEWPILKEKLIELGNKVIGWIAETVPQVVEKLRTWAVVFWDWLKEVVPPLVEKLGALATTLLTWIAEQVPFVKAKLTEWATAFWTWLVDIWPQVKTKADELATQLFDWVKAQAPVVLAKLGEWVSAFIDWVIPAAEGLLLKLPGLIADVEKWILEQIPVLSEKLSRWGTKFVNWAGDAIPPLLKKLGKLIGDVVQWIIGEGIPAIVAEMPGMADALMSFVGDAITKIGPAFLDFINAISTFITVDLFNAILDIGKSVAQGIIDGIKQGIDNLLPDLKEKINGVVDDIKGFFEDPFGISSPSTVATSWGESILDGLRLGLVNTLALAGQMGLVVLVVTAAGLLVSNAGTTAGSNFISNLVSAINLNAYTVSTALSTLSTYANNLATSLYYSGYNAGYQIIMGIAAGIYANTSYATYAMQYLGSSLANALKYALGIYSPSRVFAGLAGFIPEGVAEGIKNKTGLALDAMNGLALSLTPAIPDMAYAGSNTTTYQTTSTHSVMQQITVAVTPDTIRQYPEARNFAEDVKRILEESANKQGGGITR